MELDLNQKEEYKETELGLLPNDWEVVRLGDVGNIITGNTPSKKVKEYWDHGELDFIKPPDLQNRVISTFSEKVSNKAIEKARIVKKGSILVSCIGIIGRVGFASHRVAFNQQINAIEPNNNIYPWFLFYTLQTQQRQIENLASYTTVPIVSKAKFIDVKIPLPPLSEQKKIAYVLSIVQEAKEKTEDVIKATKELKKSMMKYLFTYGPVNLEEAEKVTLKETEIGLIPEEWNVVRLEDVVEIHDKKRIPLNSTERSKMKGNYPYCGANGIIDYVNDYIFDGEFVLLAEDGGFWRKFENSAYLMKGKFWVNNHAHIIRAIESNSVNRFLLYWLIFDDIEKSTSGTTRKKLNQNVMKNILIPLPPLPIQQKIASILSAIDQKIEAEENKKKALEDLFKSLLHNLMTAKIRVNHLENVFNEEKRIF